MRLKSPILTFNEFLKPSAAALAGAVVFVSAVSGPAHAQEPVEVAAQTPVADEFSDWAAGIGVSSLGGELHVRYQLSDQWAVRGLVAGGAANFTTFQDGFAYDYQVALGSAGAVVDWHPFDTGFRLSAGARYNNNHVDVRITPGRDEDVPSNLFDPANDLAISLLSPSEVEGTIEFWPVAPFVGMGYYGRIYKWLWLNVDAGLYYQGQPDVSLRQSEIDIFTQDRADAFAGLEDQAERDVRLLAFLPLVTFSVSYRF